MHKNTFTYFIVILLFTVLLAEISLFKSDEQRYDPSSLPYRLAVDTDLNFNTGTIPLQAKSFSKDSCLQVLQIIKSGADYHIMNPSQSNGNAEHLHIGNSPIPNFFAIDLTFDHRDEIIYTNNIDDSRNGMPGYEVGSVLLGLNSTGSSMLLAYYKAHGDYARQRIINLIRPPQGVYEHRAFHPIPLSETLYEVPSLSKKLLLYSPDSEFNLIADLDLDFYPTYGFWKIDESGEYVFTCCGSSYKYGGTDPFAFGTSAQSNIQDFTSENYGGVVQIDEKGDVRWRYSFECKVGETAIYPANQGNNLTVIYHQDLITKENTAESTTVLTLDFTDGEKIDSSKVPGKFIPFTGKSALSCGYAGVIRSSESDHSLIDIQGTVHSRNRFRLDKTNEKLPVLKLSHEQTAFACNYNDHVLLHDFSGKIIAGINGSIDYPAPLLEGEITNPQENLLIDHRGQLTAWHPDGTNTFWWFNKWFLEIFTVTLFVIVLFVIKWFSGKETRYFLRMEKDVEDLENKVTDRTRELKSLNQNLREEIQQRQILEGELKSQNQKLDTIYNSIHDAVVTINDNLQVLHYNRAFTELLKMDMLSDLTDNSITQLFINEDDRLRSIIDEVKSNHTTTRFSPVRLETLQNEYLTFELIVSPVSISTGNEEQYLMVMRDISELYEGMASNATETKFMDLIGSSDKMQEVYHLIEQVSSVDTTVLITGESGTGKDLTANAIHKLSKRSSGAFMPINCAAIPESLLESELFGHKKGAFTGAVNDKSGLFESGNDGTIFLDEIGELPLSMQAKLLRVLQDGTFSRVGESTQRTTNARIVAATNQNINRLIEQKRFREDLYYRLNAFNIEIPPLRDRKEDLPALIDHFREFFNETLDRNVEILSPEALDILMKYDYPGNIRELKNIINGAMILCHEQTLKPHHFHHDFFKPDTVQNNVTSQKTSKSKTDLKGKVLISNLQNNNWNVSKTARQMGISRTYVYKKLKQMNVEVPR